MKKIFIFVLVSLFSLNALSESDDVILVEPENQKMERAFIQAKSEADHFLAVVADKLKGTENYLAYIKFEEGETVEYLWLADVQKYDNEFYIGVVVNKPALVNNTKYGQTIGFRKFNIYDWMYFDVKNDINVGAYTTCALLEPGNVEDEQYKIEAKITCRS